MEILIALIFVCLLSFALRYSKRPKSDSRPPGSTAVPEVKGRIPVFGNGIHFLQNTTAFIRKCYNDYGKVFQINLFGSEMVLICSREMQKAMFKTDESVLSLYTIFDNLFITEALLDSRENIVRMVQLARSVVRIKPEHLDIMAEEAKSMIDAIKRDSNKKLKIGDYIREYVSKTSSRCFVSNNLPVEFLEVHRSFSKLVNFTINFTYFIPKLVMKMFWKPILSWYRKRMNKLLENEINAYRTNSEQSKCLLLRVAVDLIDESTRKPLSNDVVGDIISCFMWISTENTALGLTNAFIDLTVHSQFWNEAEHKTNGYIVEKDYKRLVCSPYLSACVMESARMNTHIFSICRAPEDKNLVIDNEKYFIGEADIVAISPPLMQVYEGSKGIFTDSESYNPRRYLKPSAESSLSKHIMTWGSGIHLCPGKEFALCEIKIGLAFLISSLKVIDFSGHDKVNYFSASAFIHRDIHVRVEVRK